MNCVEFQRFADAFVDGEFDPSAQAEFKAHLGACEPCRKQAVHLGAYRSFIKECCCAPKAPAHLRLAVCRSIDDANKENSVLPWTTLALGATAAAALMFINLGGDGADLALADTETQPIVEATVNWHRRNLPIEVTGPDSDVIRDWFQDKVDFPVRLPTFDDDIEISILGGRLSHLNNQSAAHLVYDVEGSKVSIILFPTFEQNIPCVHSERVGANYLLRNSHGYNVALFSDNGVTYAITTEMPQASFARFVSTAALGD